MTASTNTKNFFASNLLQLQNKIKRDPSSYKDEFIQTYHNYESIMQAYLMRPSKPNRQLTDLVMFVAHVAHCFPDELRTFPQQIIDILKRYATVLNPDVRLTLCKCLMLIRNKNLIEPVPLFEVFFSLIKCPNKVMRKTLFTHMLNDVRRIKTKIKNHKQCLQVQQYVFGLTKDTNPFVAKYSLNLLIELYRKQIWNDAKTVNVIAGTCFYKITKVLALAIQFFSGRDEKKDDSDSESDEEKKDEGQILLSLRVGKKTKKREKRTQRALKAVRREKKKGKRDRNAVINFSALNLIYDPQDFAEKLFKLVETTNESFELKLGILELIARLIGIHSLYLHNFHPFLIRFLNPHQREVTKILWYAAISSHELTPPDTVEPVLNTIANNFITERNSSEVIAVGLNSIREICARCPLAMTEHLLGDLVEYRSYRDKTVTAAARSLIQLFRDKNPQMLHRRMRGRPTEESAAAEAEAASGGRVRQYGEVDSKGFIPGAEVIALIGDLKGDKNELGKEEEVNAEEDSDVEEEEEGDEIEGSEGEDEGDEEEEEEEEEEEKEEVKKEKTKNVAKKRKHSDVDEDDDDDDDEGEWVDVSDDEDDEASANDANGEAKKIKLTLAEKEQLASKVSAERIFTQEDFKRIRLEQLKKKISDKNFNKGKDKSKSSIVIDSEGSEDEDKKMKSDGLIPMSSITNIRRKRDHDKATRVARIQEGREDRGKFGHREKDARLGKTNKEKNKNKAYMMIRHKMNMKQKRSFKDKQLALRASLLKQKRMK